MTTSIKFRALTHNDHKLFFEALGEYGKDFQNIQQYMAQKCGKSGSKSAASEQNKSIDPQERREQDKKEEDKKREQIRNFYNKLYAKLSQLVGKLDDRVEKVNQELYLLINYGEIWKKHGFKFNNKTKKLLEELVHQGSTTLRFKNKNVRLRTPPCKALKKINEIGIDEKVKVVTTRELPKDVVVEFHPASNRDWLKVQSIAQNPRVRAKLSIQKRISNILEFFENKWNISQDKLNRTVDAWLNCRPDGQNATLEQNQTTPDNHALHSRIRLKPSSLHELKEVNITRVVPDNHLDLSLNAYVSRLGESKPKKPEPASKNHCNNNNKETPGINPSITYNLLDDRGAIMSENFDLSHGAVSPCSRLPVSLTTPDCSILFERSSTCEEPNIRKHLNLLQSLAGSFEGCEMSRTACEDTQECLTKNQATTETDPPAAPILGPQNSDSQSVDFHIPKNLTLGDWFKMNGQGDDANDAFPNKISDDAENDIKEEIVVESGDGGDCVGSGGEGAGEGAGECSSGNKVESTQVKPTNHTIEIEKLAEGWTRQDESTMTIGELYLAFKCPEKIVLEYEFEQFSHNSSNDSLIFKLLTAASLSLAQIERSKVQPEQPGAKLKKRKSQCQTMTLHDIEATNQRVEEALKQLQPTRLSVFKRAR